MIHPDGFQVLVAFDQLLNTLTGGYADETLSARMHRKALKGTTWPEKVIDKLFFWQKAHCREAYESERQRNQLPPEYRDAE